MTLNIKQRITNYPTLHKHREPREQRNTQKRHTWIHVGRNKGKNTLSKMEVGGQREERKGEEGRGVGKLLNYEQKMK